MTPKQNSLTGFIVLMLQFESENNFNVFKDKLVLAALEKFCDLARLVESDLYWDPPEIDVSDYKEDDDPYGFNKLKINEHLKEHIKVKAKMEAQKDNLYGFILCKLYSESLDEIKRHPNYGAFNESKDPLELWLAVKQIHRVDTNSLVQEF